MYFRTDMNEIIASGHVMRCLAIAEGFKKKGEMSEFILSDNNAVDLIERRGFKTHVLNTQWNNMDSELHVLIPYVEKKCIKKLIVDSYSISGDYLRRLNNVTSVTYIDDLVKEVYDVDVLLSFTMAQIPDSFYKQYRINNTKLLVGTGYAPLREEFKKAGIKDGRSYTYDIMITTGGTDTYNVAGRLVEYLRKRYPELRILALSPKIDKMLSDEKLTIISYADNMAELMTSSKVVISAAGGTLYELCACGTPSVTFSFADNQVEFGKKMNEMGAVIYAGDARTGKNLIRVMAEGAYELINDNEKYRIMAEKMLCVTDGCGVDRIVESLCNINEERK